jgi:hypothetical protein
MLRYIPKIFLLFKLPDGTTKADFFHQSELLKDIIASFGVKGEPYLQGNKLDQDRNIGQLGLKNDDRIEVE